MQNERIQKVLIQYLIEETGIDSVTLLPDTSLFQSRLLTSIDIVNLLLFIEQTFNVHISASSVGIDQIDTLEALTKLASAPQS